MAAAQDEGEDLRRELLCSRVCSGGAVGLRPLDRENPHLQSTAQAVCFARSATPLPFLVCRFWEVAYADAVVERRTGRV